MNRVVGERATRSLTLTGELVQAFAEITGDRADLIRRGMNGADIDRARLSREAPVAAFV